MWNTIQCAVQGRGHIKSDIPCQDKTYIKNENDIQIIALADGAGSAKLSHIGAEYVTRQICENLSCEFDMYFQEDDGAAIKRKIINDLTNGLKSIARENECEVKDLASTLLVVAIKDGRYIIIHIGDGVIGYLKNDQLNIASHPENGEFVNTTVFVTSKDVLATMKILKGTLGDIVGFALMSDGTENSFYNKRERTLAPALKKLMQLTRILNIQCLENEIYKSFEEVVKNNTTDDCSLVLIVKDDSCFQGYNQLTNKEKINIMFDENEKSCKRVIRRYDTILNFLQDPKTIDAISRKIHLKGKYVKRHLVCLQEKNLVVKDGVYYRTAIRLEK